jgi:NAD(P)-dependent dehydrogenase (short-subunit alcohol dehydrogenase family)
MATAVAVVAGGASGLGEAIVERLTADDYRVVVADVDEPRAQQVADNLVAAGRRCEAMTVDVTSEGEVAACFDAVVERHGRLDALVCSAAVETRASVVDCTDDEWQRVIDVNLKGPFLCMRAAIPAMAAAGGGSVVALGSTLGLIAAPGYPAYCASKGALVNLCKQAAIEHAPDGVRVNVLAPSAHEAGLFMKMTAQAPDPDALRRQIAAHVPMGRLGRVDDVCQAVLFLASDASSYISGAVIPLDGGLAARRA